MHAVVRCTERVCEVARPCPIPLGPSLVRCAGGHLTERALPRLPFIVFPWLGLAPPFALQLRGFPVPLSLSRVFCAFVPQFSAVFLICELLEGSSRFCPAIAVCDVLVRAPPSQRGVWTKFAVFWRRGE